MPRIQTGVDRLVNLIHEKKKVSLDDAAKILGVPKLLAQEWAGLLADEGFLDVHYSFSKTFLIEREMSDEERAKIEKKVADERETLVVQAQTHIEQIRQETADFTAFKAAYEKERAALTHEMDELLATVHKLDGVESIAVASKHIEEEHQKIEARQKDLENAVMRMHDRYQEVVRAVMQCQDALLSQRTRLSDTLVFSNDVAAAFHACAASLDAMKAEIAKLKHGVDAEKSIPRAPLPLAQKPPTAH